MHQQKQQQQQQQQQILQHQQQVTPYPFQFDYDDFKQQINNHTNNKKIFAHYNYTHPHHSHHYPHQQLSYQQQFGSSSDSLNIVHEILYEQDLSRAGNLFTMNNDILLKNFPTTLQILKSIIDNRKYAANLNEQSIVEIVLTKCISALRETKMIVNYYDDLLELLEICLKYNLNNRNSYRSSVVGDCEMDKLIAFNTTPHANIVSDILSCILLDYLDPALSMKAVPVCIKLLQHHNIKRELLREICSYLNLVACRSPELLVDYVYYIVNAIFKGNSCLSRLLYQICEVNIESIYPLTKHLIKSLKTIECSEDLIYVLKIMYMISLNHVQLIIVHLEDLIGLLMDDSCQDYILDILYSIASQVPIALESYMCLFDKSSYYDSYKVDKIISMIGKSLKGKSEYCTNLLIKRIKIIQQKSSKTNSLSNRATYNNTMTNRSNNGNITTTKTNTNTNNSNNNNRIIKNTNGQILDSFETFEDEIYSSRSNRSNSYKKSNSYTYNHNYSNRNGDIDSDEYQIINNTNNNNNNNNNNIIISTNANNNFRNENESKRCLQILNEIYAIASVHPQVLDTCFKPIFDLYQNPSDNVKIILEQLKELQSSSRICSTNQLNTPDNQEENYNNNNNNNTNHLTINSSKRSFEHSLDSIENDLKVNKNFNNNNNLNEFSSSINNNNANKTITTNANNKEINNDTIQNNTENLIEINIPNNTNFMDSNNDHNDVADDDDDYESKDKNDTEHDYEVIKKDDESILLAISLTNSNNQNINSNLNNNNNNNNNNKIEKSFETNLMLNEEEDIDLYKYDDENLISNANNNNNNNNSKEIVVNVSESIELESITYNKLDDSSNSKYNKLKTSPLSTLINESITYSLLNTKIAEEPEELEEDEDDDDDDNNDDDDDDEDEDDVGETEAEKQQQNEEDEYDHDKIHFENETKLMPKEKTDTLNSFAYVKLNEPPLKQNQDYRSFSLREPLNADSTKQFYANNNLNNSYSYTAKPKDDYFLHKDVVQQFCEKHLEKIKNYIKNINKILPMPAEEKVLNHSDFNTTERTRQNFFMKKFKNKKFCSINFSCQCKGEYCLYDQNYFEIITFFPSIWIHIMFLSIQSKLTYALRQQDSIFIAVKRFYEALNEKTPFVALITSSFPSEKKIKELVDELKEMRFFDLFESKSLDSNEMANQQDFKFNEYQWQCYLCSNPDKANDILNEKPLIQGQLKEKHGKWKFLKRWRKRIYTLTGGNIVYFKKDMRQESLSVRYIRNIQTLKSCGSSKRNIPKAFEIFTDTNSFILKAQNSQDAEQWIQYLQLSKAVENSRFALLNEHNNSSIFKTSL